LPLRDGVAALDVSDPARKQPEEGPPDRSGAASRIDSDQRILDVAVFADARPQLLSLSRSKIGRISAGADLCVGPRSGWLMGPGPHTQVCPYANIGSTESAAIKLLCRSGTARAVHRPAAVQVLRQKIGADYDLVKIIQHDRH